MSAKRKEIIDIISFEKGYVSSLKDESDVSSQAKDKNHHLKNDYCIILILYLIIHLLPINKILSNIYSSFNKQLNKNEFTTFHTSNSKITKNRISSSNILGIFLMIYKTNKLYEHIFSNSIDFFSEMNFYKNFFLVIIDIYIIILNIIKKNEEKIIYFIFIKKEVTQNYLSGYVNKLIKIKNKMINNNYKKNKNDNINISQRNKRKILF